MAKLISPREPVKVNSVVSPTLLDIVAILQVGCQNCINIGDRKTVPDCALKVMLIFSVESE